MDVSPRAKLIEDFKRELELLSGQVYVPDDIHGAISTVLDIIRSHQARRIMAWEKVHLGLPGPVAALTEAGVAIEDNHVPPSGKSRQVRLQQLEGVKVGVSGAAGGLTDTGAVALSNGPGRGQLVSLLPPVHIALLPVTKLFPSLPAFLANNPEATEARRNLVFVAGPSRTGDIEMTLTMGVHGPGEVHVIMIS